MVEAGLVQIDKDGRERDLGSHAFLELPRIGDGIVVAPLTSMFIHHLVVSAVNHRPAMIPDPDRSPKATVYAKLVGMEG